MRDFYDAAFPCRVVLTQLTNAEIQLYAHSTNGIPNEEEILENDRPIVHADNIDDAGQCKTNVFITYILETCNIIVKYFRLISSRERRIAK